MAIHKSKTWTVGDVECRLHRYDSGLLEVGFYTPEFLKNGGPILRCVVTQHERAAPVFAHLSNSGSRGQKYRTIKAATAACIADAQKVHTDIATAPDPATLQEAIDLFRATPNHDTAVDLDRFAHEYAENDWIDQDTADCLRSEANAVEREWNPSI